MAPPTDASDPAPPAKHKKKKKKKNKEAAEESVTVTLVTPNSVATGQNSLPAGPSLDTERRGDGTKSGSDAVGTKKKKKKEKKQKTDLTVTPIPMASETKQKGGKKRKRSEEGPKVTPPIGKGPNVIPPTKKKRKERQQKERAPRVRKRKIRTSEHLDDLELMELQEYSVTENDLVELEEYIPDVRRKAKDRIWKMKKYDLPRLREFKRQGLSLRWGKYTYQENLQIRRNVADFLKLTGIESVDELFFPIRFPDREQSLKNLRSKHNFFCKLADGLLRTCEQVYIRGRKIFDSRNNRGRFSEEENWQLQKFHTMHGNDWKTISNKLDRSIWACEKRYSALGGTNGPWTSDEEQKFYKAVKKHLKHKLRTAQSPGPGPGPTWVQLCSKLPWTKISRKVQTRSFLQCRVKWFSYLKSRLKAVQPKKIQESSLQTRIRLIQTLYELQVEEVFDVDWVEISKSVGGVTPICVQKFFHRMKVSCIPGWTTMSFGEMVDVLFEKELPRLQKKLKNPDPEPRPGPDLDRLSLDQLFPKEQFQEVDNS